MQLVKLTSDPRIAKQIVEAHGGKIWAESGGAGKGTRFIVQLPSI